MTRRPFRTFGTAAGITLLSCLCIAQQSPSFEEKYRAAQNALISGDSDKAQRGFEELTVSNPAVAEIHANLGLIYFNRKDFAKAVVQLRKALALKPSLSKSEDLLAMSYSELGRYTDALPGLQRCFSTSDHEIRRLCGLQLLRAYTGLSQDAKAVSTALNLNDLYPKDPEILYQTGRIYGNFAYVTIGKLHDAAPDSIWMAQADGEANESQKNYESAISAFRRVLMMDSRRPGIHYRLGRVYRARLSEMHNPSDRVAAKAEFSAELDLDPDNGNARYELAQFAAEDNDLGEARRQFEIVVHEYPEFEEALVGLGAVYLSMNLPSDAASILQKATSLSPSDDVAWYKLAMAERKMGNRDASAKDMEHFRAIRAASSASVKPPSNSEITPQTIGEEIIP